MGFFEQHCLICWMLIFFFSRINSVFTDWDTPSVRILDVLIGCASLGKLLNLLGLHVPSVNEDDGDTDLAE